MMTAGYSGTPLAKKLSLRQGLRAWFENMPGSVAAEIADSEVELLPDPEPPIEAAHIFVTESQIAEEVLKVKVCAVDATWSGLKLMIRRDRR